MMKNNLTTFYLIRHGETDWNKTGKTQGQTDTQLNDTGIQQAKEAAELFKKVTFDFAFSSDLMRAKRTADIIALEHNLAIKTTKLLREKHFGSLTTKPYSVIMTHSKLMSALNKEEKMKYRVASDAENDEELAARVFTFLRETALAYPGKNILVGTHGGVLRIILIHLGITSYEEYEHMRMRNTGYIKLLSDGVDFFVKETNGFEARQKATSDL
jgi:broad specificity phosphatase PhoE